MKKIALCTLGILSLLSNSTMAQQLKDFDVYARAGVPNIGIGVGYALSPNLTLRGDLTTFGSFSRDFKQRDIDYHAKLKNDKANVMLDYFPFENGFRVTSGLGFLRTKVTATGQGRSKSDQTFKIGEKTYHIAIDSSDTVEAQFNYPSVSPYLGVGFGHNIKRQRGGEWGFLVDVGIYLGKGKANLSISDSLNQKLLEAEQQSGLSAIEAQQIIDSNVDNEKGRFENRVNKYKVIPAVSIGVSYKF